MSENYDKVYYDKDTIDDVDVNMNKLAVINGEVVEDVARTPDNVDVQKQQEELDLIMKYIEGMRKMYYMSALDNLRPSKFPVDLWQYITDSQKVLVPDRWKMFKEKCSQPERLQEII